MPEAGSSAQPRLLSDDLAAKIGSEPFQGLFGVSVARVELEDAVEIVARRAPAAQFIVQIGPVAVGRHRFRIELDCLGIVGERRLGCDARVGLDRLIVVFQRPVVFLGVGIECARGC